jgi:hypothetical protein
MLIYFLIPYVAIGGYIFICSNESHRRYHHWMTLLWPVFWLAALLIVGLSFPFVWRPSYKEVGHCD